MNSRSKSGAGHRRATRTAAQRGFTLIELIVALTAGLLVSAAAFMMARNATHFFQHEAGITSAQYAAMVGFARLQADIKNAAFLGTGNVSLDDNNDQLCGATGNFAAAAGARVAGMQDLAGINIIENGSFADAAAPLQTLWGANGMAPDSLTISGSFNTTEQFAAAAVTGAGGGAYTVVLNEENDGATIRTRNASARGGATFQQIFRPGRILRVRDREGRYSLGVIASVVDAAPQVQITLEGAPALGKREVNTTCGCTGFCVGAPVNVIARMYYSLRSVAAVPEYANLFEGAVAAAAYHRGAPVAVERSELVRVEVDEEGNEIAGTHEVLAEFAVDLEFGATYEAAGAPTSPPTIVREPVGTAGNRYTIADWPSNGGRPDLIRSLQVRLRTRAHRRDREVGLDLADGTDMRFDLGANRGFARMRTLIADVALPNQRARMLP